MIDFIGFFIRYELWINVVCFPLGILALSCTKDKMSIASVIFILSWFTICINLLINVIEKGF